MAADSQAQFLVGGRYRNRRGAYEVIDIFPPQMRVRYDDGEVCVVDMAIQARIMTNMAEQTRTTRVDPRSDTGGRPGSTARIRNPLSATRTRQWGSGSVSPREGTSPAHTQFIRGSVYSRRELHERYGGQEQGGISTPRSAPVIFLFTGASGSTYGYRDHWDDDNVFHYSGEGQIGDMEFVRGNRAVRDHEAQRKALHLFETVGSGDVRYLGQMRCAGYDLVAKVPDLRGVLRTAIVFRLIPEGEG